MGLEIERKWLFTGDLSQVVADINGVSIQDYYYNPFTRLRYTNGTYVLTIKSGGTFIRDEVEYVIPMEQVNLDSHECLNKIRYYVPYKDNIFEINVFKQIPNLITVEHEYKNIMESIPLPDWVGQDITEQKQYYGFNLFTQIQVK